MPSTTMWLQIGKADVRVYKRIVGNSLLTPDPVLQKQVDGEQIRETRTISESHWEHVGTGETLTVETMLKNTKGDVIPMAQALHILEHTKNIAVNGKAEAVDKAKITIRLVNADGSIGDQVLPYPSTERIRVVETAEEATEPGDAYWVPSTVTEGFLFHEEYELPAADPRNDVKLFNEAEEAAKRDEVLVTTFSNGGFTLRILSRLITEPAVLYVQPVCGVP